MFKCKMCWFYKSIYVRRIKNNNTDKRKKVLLEIEDLCNVYGDLHENKELSDWWKKVSNCKQNGGKNFSEMKS